MTFAAFVVKNVLRQRMRTGLTIVGIAVGITTVVALGVLTSGFTRTAESMISRGGADFMVAQDGAADLSFSTLPVADVETVAARPGVEHAIGVLLQVSQVRGSPTSRSRARRPATCSCSSPTWQPGGCRRPTATTRSPWGRARPGASGW